MIAYCLTRGMGGTPMLRGGRDVGGVGPEAWEVHGALEGVGQEQDLVFAVEVGDEFDELGAVFEDATAGDEGGVAGEVGVGDGGADVGDGDEEVHVVHAVVHGVLELGADLHGAEVLGGGNHGAGAEGVGP